MGRVGVPALAAREKALSQQVAALQRQKVVHLEESAAAQAQYVETLRAQMGGAEARRSRMDESARRCRWGARRRRRRRRWRSSTRRCSSRRRSWRSSSRRCWRRSRLRRGVKEAVEHNMYYVFVIADGDI